MSELWPQTLTFQFEVCVNSLLRCCVRWIINILMWFPWRLTSWVHEASSDLRFPLLFPLHFDGICMQLAERRPKNLLWDSVCYKKIYNLTILAICCENTLQRSRCRIMLLIISTSSQRISQKMASLQWMLASEAWLFKIHDSLFASELYLPAIFFGKYRLA